MALKLANQATSALATNINASATTITITSGDEAKFPALGADDWFPLVLVDASNNIEIVRCTARSGVTLTVTRGQESTTARSFLAGARVDLRLTAAAIEAFSTSAELANKLDKTGDTMTGLLTLLGGTSGGVLLSNGEDRTRLFDSADRAIVRPWNDRFNIRTQADSTLFDVNDSAAAPTFKGNALWHTGNDGATSGLDADLLDGQQGAYYANVLARLGYTPADITGEEFLGEVSVPGGTSTSFKSGESRYGSNSSGTYIGAQASQFRVMTANLATTMMHLDGSAGTFSTFGHIMARVSQIPSLVPSAVAGMSAGSVGSYGFFAVTGTGQIARGNTIAGSSLYYSNGGGVNFNPIDLPAPAGTWRCMGAVRASGGGVTQEPGWRSTLFLRIS